MKGIIIKNGGQEVKLTIKNGYLVLDDEMKPEDEGKKPILAETEPKADVTKPINSEQKPKKKRKYVRSRSGNTKIINGVKKYNVNGTSTYWTLEKLRETQREAREQNRIYIPSLTSSGMIRYNKNPDFDEDNINPDSKERRERLKKKKNEVEVIEPEIVNFDEDDQPIKLNIR